MVFGALSKVSLTENIQKKKKKGCQVERRSKMEERGREREKEKKEEEEEEEERKEGAGRGEDKTGRQELRDVGNLQYHRAQGKAPALTYPGTKSSSVGPPSSPHAPLHFPPSFKPSPHTKEDT